MPNPHRDAALALPLTEAEHAAVRGVLSNQPDCIAHALARGFKPDVVTLSSRTPLLHLALYTGADDAVIDVLLKAGANPAALDARCRTAVAVAELMGRRDALRMLQR